MRIFPHSVFFVDCEQHHSSDALVALAVMRLVKWLFFRANGIDTTAMRFKEKIRDQRLFSLFEEINRAHRFKKSLGVPPLVYLNTLRMERASAMLAESDRPIAEIAAACGFESPSYFARTFRRTFGVLPSRYRDMQKDTGVQ